MSPRICFPRSTNVPDPWSAVACHHVEPGGNGDGRGRTPLSCSVRVAKAPESGATTSRGTTSATSLTGHHSPRVFPGWSHVLACFAAAILTFAAATDAAELQLDFASMTNGAPPAPFRAALTGGGPPPDWRLVEIATPSPFETVIEPSSSRSHETVMAQLSTDATDERFPLLIYGAEEFADFTASLKFRTVSGKAEQMAGLAFRLKDERNYYVIRASSLGNTLRFYKFVDGVRSDPIGVDLKIPSGEWHTLEVSAKGNQIRCRLDDREAIPMLTDTSFVRGRFALWTKSDSVSHFKSLRLHYDVLKTLPQRLVERAQEKFPRLLGVTIYARQDGKPVALASTDPAEIGRPGASAEEKALGDGLIQAGGAPGYSSAVFPLRDRNGDPMFALRLKLRSFAGQTEANVAARGKSIADELEMLVRAAEHADEIAGRGR